MMKKIACTLFGLMLLGSVAAQEYNPEALVPIDPAVKMGKLDNGLTYYIRQNGKPANRANMYIVHRVGARLEEDRQNGLAHFTEHMAFKGTTHFPGDAITKYCEQNGIKFGNNLNAFTTIDRTTYMITGIPLEREALMDSLLLVLHDWSGKFLFDPEMLETERGVIREERRTYGGAGFRINEQLRKAMYNNSIYSKRNVIGDIDVLNTFKMNDILDFYNKWYRPDLQAVILVGDFNPVRMEAKVKKIFGDLPKPETMLDYPQFDIPDNDDILFGTAIDPEAGNLNIRVMYKLKGNSFQDRGKEKYMYGNRINRLINSMLNERILKLYLAKEQPFTSVSASLSEWIEDKDAFYASVTPKKGQATQALQILLTELERVKRYGFTEPELERAKANILNQEESAYSQRNNWDNGIVMQKFADQFTGNNSIPSVDYRIEFTTLSLPIITLK
jgi:zinc protease